MATLEYSKTVRKAREEAGLTREQLALKAETSTSTVARLELSGNIPNGATLVRIANILDIPIHAFSPIPSPTSPEFGESAPVTASSPEVDALAGASSP